MNWSRAKNILIALLVAVNAFLLVVYITREVDLRRDELTVRADVCKILDAQGIKVNAGIVPMDSVEINPVIFRGQANGEELAKRLFTDVATEENESGTSYSGNGGSIMLSTESFSLVYESGRVVENSAEAVRLAANIAKKLFIETKKDRVSVTEGDGGYTIKMQQLFSGVAVFDCELEFKISASGSVIASGKLIGRNNAIVQRKNVLRASALMLAFAEAVQEKRIAPLTITGIELGYVSELPTAGRAYLSPTAKFETDKGVFYMDMQNGRLFEI